MYIIFINFAFLIINVFNIYIYIYINSSIHIFPHVLQRSRTPMMTVRPIPLPTTTTNASEIQALLLLEEEEEEEARGPRSGKFLRSSKHIPGRLWTSLLSWPILFARAADGL